MKFSVRDEIIEVVNKLFVYTDGQEWNKLLQEVFSDKIDFDMSSLGGEKSTLTAEAICEIWRNGFAGIDSVNHLPMPPQLTIKPRLQKVKQENL